MANVYLKDVYKYYEEGKPAVDNFNAEIKDREFVVLVGPSGCGKSTTLRMIAGLEQITAGEIFIDDNLVNHVPPKDRDIAMVFQNYALYPHMTVYDNMAFGLKLRKFPKSEIRQRVEDAANILGIQELLHRKPKALSGGQRQRVAVGRAIVRHPKVFLFDEPLSNLDAKLRVQMRTEISKLHNRLQTTMIYVTHDQVEAMTMGSRIVVMKDGIVQQIDTPMHLYKQPANRFVAGFIGSPSMNLIDGKLIRNGGLKFDDGNLNITLTREHENKLAKYVGKEITFGIRPEDIHDPAQADSLPQTAKTQLSVEVVEPMGNETFLYATTGQNTLTIRLRTEKPLQAGQQADLVFDLSKVHFFDRDTEEAVV